MQDSDTPAGAPETPPDLALFQMMYGFMPSRLVYVAARLGIADHMHAGEITAPDLARRVGADEHALRRIMRGLVNIGVLVEDEEGRFGLTHVGEFLRSDVPGSLRDLAILSGEEFYPAWGALLNTVRSGQTAFDSAFGTGFFRHLEQHPEAGERFNNFMVALTTDTAAAALEAYDFSPFRRIVDVGGGYGPLLAALLKANPQAEGVLFDTETITQGARRYLESAGLLERCEIVAGDFFEAVPAGGNLYVLSQVLHDWDDGHCLRILKSCREAMPEGSTLLVLEALMPEHVGEPSSVVDSDLIMLAMTGGRERTEAEYRDLLAASGFRLARIVPTQSPTFVIEAMRVAEQ
ncbi:MAG TPA: methyltransferase [Chloroflexia bacterium]|nr:methyltransferase [Chloroflexia bacterium]